MDDNVPAMASNHMIFFLSAPPVSFGLSKPIGIKRGPAE
jgi:hypothetical protein